jgi:synaptotagmin-like protein
LQNPAVSTLAYKGDLEVALKYITPENVSKEKTSKKSKESQGELQVMIKGARNLTAVRANGFSDSFCKG